MKTCRTCKAAKPDSDFYKAPQNTDGLSNQCKGCAIKYQLDRYVQNREVLKAYQREYRRKSRTVRP